MTNQQPPSARPDDNPFFTTWSTQFGVPPFERILPEHFSPAFARAFSEHEAEVAAIAENPATPTFENTIAALELSGQALARADHVFNALAGAHTNDALLALERELSPRMAKHWNAIRMNASLFARIDALYRTRERLGLTDEQVRVLERYHTSFKRSGAALDDANKKKLAALTERLATLGTAFSQNVLADEQAYTLLLESEDELSGLPDFLCAAASAAAEERGHAGKYAITTSRSSVEPFLQFSSRRDLREKIFRAWMVRGENGGATDNAGIIAETMKLRVERAKLLGYETFAHFRLDDAMAKTPATARALLEQVWAPARTRALVDRDDLQSLVREEGGNFKLAPWDWRYYAQKLRKVRCDIDEAAIKPYLQLDQIIEAAFDTAQRLFGLKFARADVPVWHPDVRAWEVRDAQGRHVALFFGDYFARPSKHGGAWMTTLRDQRKVDGDFRPLVINVMNFNKGEPTLLSMEDARTLFHEFGHGLHGMLSDVTYPMVAGTSVFTDFVEVPSQLYEHWLEQPQVLRRFARHVRTGEAMPEPLLQKLIAARTFDRARETLEYLSSAFFDLDLHQDKSSKTSSGSLAVKGFEEAELSALGMPAEIAMRHRPPHFAHVFAGNGYASAYYSYLWSEVLDADAFNAFEEAGDIFDPATAKRLKDHIYSAGNTRDPEALYLAFRGRMPTADALLKKRGFGAMA
jgi:peptidyl-dipeptidase Dcp